MANAFGIGRPGLPAPFKIPGFTGLWVSASAGSFARVVTQIALSWVTLEATESPFLVGVVYAARMVPQLVLGIPSGALADIVDRRLLIIAVNVATIVLLLGLVAVSEGGLASTPILVGVSVLFGILDTLRMAASQAYAYDLVRTHRATSGMALNNLGGQLASTAGGLVGGYALEKLGSSATFGITAFAVLLAVMALVQFRGKSGGRWIPASTPQRSPRATASPASSNVEVTPAPTEARGESARPAARPARPPVNLGRAMTLLLRNRVLAILSLAIILAEIFGFASQTLLPTFAKDVFDVGASGLGLMMAVRSAGGSLGLLALSRIGAEGRSGLGFVIGAALFGLALLLFASSPFYALALLLLGISGLCASVMDTLGQTLLQRNADEHERGSAMGIWVFSVGFGPVGHLTLGAAASSFGAPLTQAVSGIMLILVAGVMALHAPLRRAR